MQLGSRLELLTLTLLAVGGCAQGVESNSFTFGPVDPPAGDTEATANTSGPIDPTTGGNGSQTGDDMGEATDANDDDPVPTSGVDDSTTGGPMATTDEPETTDPGPMCGDGTADPGENCDGDDLGGASCDSIGMDFNGGTLACNADCTFDATACTSCGDGVADPGSGEDCDMADLGGMTCADIDPTFTGTLACDATCTFDTSSCGVAGSTTVCSSPGAAIPDNDPTGLSDVITLAAGDVGGTVTDVDVEVDLDHTWIGDLTMSVTGAGSSVTVFAAQCGNVDNLHKTFDDESGIAIDCVNTNSNLVVQPNSPLSGFDGGTVSADWTLQIVDGAGSDLGTLTQWCVTVSYM
ncbi:MAG: proprotein convertase P-domain-containing protein [Myxococcota bacterium]